MQKPKSPCAKDCPNRSGECRKDCQPWKLYEEQKMKLYNERTFDPWIEAHKRTLEKWYAKDYKEQKRGRKR